MGKYANYRTAFERAKMFASEEVRTILEGKKKPGPDTLDYAIQSLRRSEDEAEANEVRIKHRNGFGRHVKLLGAHDTISRGEMS